MRIDYILLQKDLLCRVHSSWTDDVIDLNQTSPDHRPVGCQVQWETKRTSQKRPRYNLSALSNPSVRQRVDQALRDLPEIPWSCDVHHHAQQIRKNIHTVLSTVIPAERGGPKSSFISDNAWGIRTMKQQIKRQLQTAETRISWLWFRWSFESWNKNRPLYEQYRAHLHWLFQQERKMAMHRMTLKYLVYSIRQGLQGDRTRHLEQLSDECAHQPLHIVYKNLKKIGVGSSLKKKAKKPLPSLRQMDGSLATSELEMAEIWRQHCQTLEAGEVVSTRQLLVWALTSSNHRHIDSITTDHIPSLTDLEKHFRKMKTGKATGADMVPSDICHYCPAALSRVVFPLLLKQAMTASEALEYKGGTLVAAYKGKGRHDSPASYRGLMLTSVIGKAIRSAFREKLLPKYRSFLHPTYFSARDAGHVGQACMSLQLFCQVSKQMGQSAAVIFLDIRSAYYAVCRELATGWSGSDSQLSHLLSYFDMPEDSIHSLHRVIDSFGGAAEAAEMDEVQIALLTELSTATWFRVQSSPATTQTHGGSRPGDGLADVIFAFIFGRMLQMLKDELRSSGYWDLLDWDLPVHRTDVLHAKLPLQDTPTNLDIVWADDLAIALRDSDAGSVVERAQHITGYLFDWCHRYGLRPNTDKGKSEILLQLRGSHSRVIRTQLYTPQEPQLDIPTKLAPLVPMYKHLGAQLHVGGKLLHEAKIRGGMMKAAYNQVARKTFKNPKLPLKQRGQLLDSLVFSILRWNLGAWYELDGATYRKFRSSIMTLARRTCIVPHGTDTVWKWRDEDVLSELHLPPVESMHLARLSFFTTAFHTAPDALWTLIIAEGSWLRCVRHAVFWLFQQLQGSTPYPIYHEFESAWMDGVRTRGPKWRGWIARAKKHAVLQRHKDVTVRRWHSQFYDDLVQAGVPMERPTPILSGDSTDHPFVCGPCRQVFRTYTAWCTHAHKKHGRTDPLRNFLVDGVCRCCLNNYHTMRRLLAHLHYSRRCARNHVGLTMWTEQQPGRNSRGEDLDRALPIPVVKPDKKIGFFG